MPDGSGGTIGNSAKGTPVVECRLAPGARTSLLDDRVMEAVTGQMPPTAGARLSLPTAGWDRGVGSGSATDERYLAPVPGRAGAVGWVLDREAAVPDADPEDERLT